MANRADIGQNLEFKSAYNKGLHLQAGRAFGSVAESDGDGIAFTQIAAMQLGRQGTEPGTLMYRLAIMQGDA